MPKRVAFNLENQVKTKVEFYFTDVSDKITGSMVECLKRRACDQHGLGSNLLVPFCCVLGRHFTALSPAWWSWQAVLNYSHISIKLQADNNILVSPEAGRGNCLPSV